MSWRKCGFGFFFFYFFFTFSSVIELGNETAELKWELRLFIPSSLAHELWKLAQ